MELGKTLLKSGSKLTFLFTFAIFASLMHSAFATDWYVDDALGNDSYDGTTPQTAKKTIQAAVNRAAKNDTVKVAEGVYADENAYDASTVACVVISNNLTLVATGSKERTHIVGRHANTSTGVGEGAVRCIFVKEKAVARIEGFTIRDGATISGNGGGVSFSVYNKADGWLVDCVVSNCVASRGGALLYGTAIRCLFAGNNSTSYGKVASQSILYNCLVVDNVGSDRLFNYPRDIVNCTIAGNSNNSFCYASGAHNVFNTIFLENANQSFYNSLSVISNCLITTGTASFNRTASGLCATNDTGACFVAPVIGDWRPRSDSGAVGLGDAAHLLRVALPDENMRYVDFAGNPIVPVDGKITCGALQETVTPASGRLTFDGSFELEGLGLANSSQCNYLHATNYPCMYVVKAVGATISNIVWYAATTGHVARVPALDGRLGVMPPPEGSMTLSPVRPNKVFYVDANDGDDGYEGSDIGSWDHPYKTLQAAVNAVPNGRDNDRPNYAVICAKPGDYSEGGTVGTTISRRLTIPSAYKRFRIVALEGPERTIIRGESAEDAADGIPCACIFMNVPSVVQGFTLTGGHTVLESNDEDTATAGSVLGCALSVTDRMIADCIVSNNVSRFAAQRSGLSVRCVFLDNTEIGTGGGDLRNGCGVHDIFRTSASSHRDAYTLGSGARAYFTTYSGSKHSSATLRSALAVSSSAKFVDMAADDYRLCSDSPAFGAGDSNPTNYWQYASIDIEGNPLFFIDGRSTSGAYQRPSATAVALNAAAAGHVTMNGGTSLSTVLFDGQSVTVAKAEGCLRNLLGFTSPDGEFSLVQTSTFIAPEHPEAGRLYGIEAVFSTNWYVNAGALGSDSNDGFTPETPKKTLAGAMVAVVPGDVVHAAPGEYADGIMYNPNDMGYHGGETVIGSRVFVTNGVSLVSDEGADSTHIVGASASAEYDVQLGLGSNAVRCVSMGANTRLKGFTLRGGRTNGRVHFEDSTCGAGVLGTSSVNTFVEDCVISNCVAIYGGCGYSVNFKRCRFFHNRAVERASVSRVSSFDSCVADWNQGTRPFDYFNMLTNCTIGAHMTTSEGGSGTLLQPTDPDKTLVIDCLILSGIHTRVKMRRTAARSNSGVLAANCEDCILTNAAALAVDDDCRPIVGSNVAIDAIPLAEDAPSVRTAKDAYGVQRVFNGARDLGALDADWRDHYAKTLGGSKIAVTAVDPAVVETNGALRIPEGSVELTWRSPNGRSIVHEMGMSVNGGGTLLAERGGNPLASVTEQNSGVFKFNQDGTTDMRFAYEPSGGEGEYAELRNFSLNIGFAVVIH